jgi:prepilin-type N-terminal cleavage/methylation domain-containing protein/prepilin-type processing-associated H-X9-DG protein
MIMTGYDPERSSRTFQGILMSPSSGEKMPHFPTRLARGNVFRSDIAFRVSAERPRSGFTLVELLVVIGIIAVLISLAVPALARAREQGREVTCASHLRSIAQAVQCYAVNNGEFMAPFKNNTSWTNPANPAQMTSPNDPNAYWGVAYAVAGGLPIEIFTCPSNVQKLDVSGYPNENTAYGYNGWGDYISGMDDGQRLQFFGSKTEIALYRRNGLSWDAYAMGRKFNQVKFPSQTILAQDAWEATLDANGDTYASYTAATRGQLTEYPGHDIEYLRHTGTSNVVFVDGHVERLDKSTQTDERYYTGNWRVPRSY